MINKEPRHARLDSRPDLKQESKPTKKTRMACAGRVRQLAKRVKTQEEDRRKHSRELSLERSLSSSKQKARISKQNNEFKKQKASKTLKLIQNRTKKKGSRKSSLPDCPFLYTEIPLRNLMNIAASSPEIEQSVRKPSFFQEPQGAQSDIEFCKQSGRSGRISTRHTNSLQQERREKAALLIQRAWKKNKQQRIVQQYSRALREAFLQSQLKREKSDSGADISSDFQLREFTETVGEEQIKLVQERNNYQFEVVRHKENKQNKNQEISGWLETQLVRQMLEQLSQLLPKENPGVVKPQVLGFRTENEAIREYLSALIDHSLAQTQTADALKSSIQLYCEQVIPLSNYTIFLRQIEQLEEQDMLQLSPHQRKLRLQSNILRSHFDKCCYDSLNQMLHEVLSKFKGDIQLRVLLERALNKLIDNISHTKFLPLFKGDRIAQRRQSLLNLIVQDCVLSMENMWTDITFDEEVDSAQIFIVGQLGSEVARQLQYLINK